MEWLKPNKNVKDTNNSYYVILSYKIKKYMIITIFLNIIVGSINSEFVVFDL
jgi:hypothetical protein